VIFSAGMIFVAIEARARPAEMQQAKRGFRPGSREAGIT
jgi:hypothetical protein